MFKKTLIGIFIVVALIEIVEIFDKPHKEKTNETAKVETNSPTNELAIIKASEILETSNVIEILPNNEENTAVSSESVNDTTSKITNIEQDIPEIKVTNDEIIKNTEENPYSVKATAVLEVTKVKEENDNTQEIKQDTNENTQGTNDKVQVETKVEQNTNELPKETNEIQQATEENNIIDTKEENLQDAKQIAKQKMLNSIAYPKETYRKNAKGDVECKFNFLEAKKLASDIIDESFKYDYLWNGEELTYKIVFVYDAEIMEHSMYFPYRSTAIVSGTRSMITGGTYYIWAEDYYWNGEFLHTQYCIR